MKPTAYYNDTWRQAYLFFIGCPLEDMVAYVLKKYKSMPPEDYPNAAGMTAEIRNEDGKSIILIWVESGDLTPEALANLGHECLHAANRTSVNRGYVPDPNNDEAHTYLFTVIYEQALKGMNYAQKSK